MIGRRMANIIKRFAGYRDDMRLANFDRACELGFCGSLDEWERLMGAVARREIL